ncbi:hypothetical protein CXG81DRAFT_5929, partial [Caulochytrium protostelioides]
YVPPSLRARQAAAANAKPAGAAAPAAGAANVTTHAQAGDAQGWGRPSAAFPTNDRAQALANGRVGASAGGGRFNSAGGQRAPHYAKDPSDEFYDRPDIKPRNAMEETQLYGDQHNSGINFSNYDNIPVDASGSNAPEPIADFTSSSLDPLAKSNVALAGYNSPTPVQRWSVSIVTQGRDLMACAQTGSGKTAAFLLPILSQNFKDGAKSRPVAVMPPYGSRPMITPKTLILAPTRELAIQIYEEARKFAYRSWVRPCVAYGGQPMQEQLRDMERGCGLLVATPGRLVDMIERGRISLSGIRYLVLDEADRMLDMGFEPQIRRLVEQEDMPISTERQTLMFSATFPHNIQMLARDFLNDYIFLTVGRVGSTSENIKQSFEYVEPHDKRSTLLDILHTDAQLAGKNLTLVFVETKKEADMLCRYLVQSDFPATAIHGDRTQREREWALSTFRSGQTPVLVATAVAARGLDIPNVTHVVNYDLPSDVDDYVHRIGRTGRAGNTGKATSFFNMQQNAGISSELCDVLSEANQEIPGFLSTARSESRGGGRGFGGRPGRGRGGGRGGGNRFGSTDFRKDPSAAFGGASHSGAGSFGGSHGGSFNHGSASGSSWSNPNTGSSNNNGGSPWW